MLLLVILFFPDSLIVIGSKISFVHLNAYYTEFLGLAEMSEVDHQKVSSLISVVTSGRERNLDKVQNLLSLRE